MMSWTHFALIGCLRPTRCAPIRSASMAFSVSPVENRSSMDLTRLFLPNLGVAIMDDEVADQGWGIEFDHDEIAGALPSASFDPRGFVAAVEKVSCPIAI